MGVCGIFRLFFIFDSGKTINAKIMMKNKNKFSFIFQPECCYFEGRPLTFPHFPHFHYYLKDNCMNE